MTATSTQQPEFGRTPLQTADAVGISLLAIGLLVLSYLRSRNSMFWSDEIMGLFVIRQPTLSSALHFWNDGIDSSGIWFQLLARPWAIIFGTSEITLRLFSAVGTAASACMLWIAARRFYSILPVAASITLVYSLVGPLFWQLINGRTYGVFLFACALVIYLLLRGEDKDTVRPRPIFLIYTFAAYTLLVGSHVLGIFWMGAFLCLQLALDLRSRRFRPLLYLCAAASVIVFIFSLTNIKADVALGKPSFWTKPPGLYDFLTTGLLFNKETLAVIVVLLCFALWQLHYQRVRMPIYILLLGFLSIDLFLFVFSHLTTSIYFYRYLLPMSFAAIFLLCEILTQIAEAKKPFHLLRTAIPILLICLAMAHFVVHEVRRSWLPLDNYTHSLLAVIPPGIPSVVTDPGVFVELEFYHHNDPALRLLYPVDWPVALEAAHTIGASGAHEMDNFKADGIYAVDILPTADILKQNSSFSVIAPAGDLWMQRRVLNNPNLSAALYGRYTIGKLVPVEIWLVHSR